MSFENFDEVIIKKQIIKEKYCVFCLVPACDLNGDKYYLRWEQKGEFFNIKFAQDAFKDIPEPYRMMFKIVKTTDIVERELVK